MRIAVGILSLALLAGSATAQTSPGEPQFCNRSELDQWVVVAHILPDGTQTSEGWLKLENGQCLTPFAGRPAGTRSYYYSESETSITGQPVRSSGFMKFCIARQRFQISVREACPAGYQSVAGFEALNRADSTLGLCDESCRRSNGIRADAKILSMRQFNERHPIRPASQLGYPDFQNTRIDSATAPCLRHVREVIRDIESARMETSVGRRHAGKIVTDFAASDWGSETRLPASELRDLYAEGLADAIAANREADKLAQETAKSLRQRRQDHREEEEDAADCRADPDCELDYDATADNARALAEASANYADSVKLKLIEARLASSSADFYLCVMAARGIVEFD